MPRKELEAYAPQRLLVSAKIWDGAVWVPGQEQELPEDFPMDGPHWNDWEPEERALPRGAEALRRPDDDIELSDEEERYLRQNTTEAGVLPVSRKGPAQGRKRGRA